MSYRETQFTKKAKDSGKFRSMWNDKRIEKVRRLYVDEGKSIRKVAEELGCSIGAVQNLLNANGWMRRKESHKTKPLIDQVVSMYVDDKMLIDEIGSKLCIHPSSVRYHLQARGLLRTAKQNSRIEWGKGKSANARKVKRILKTSSLVPSNYAEYCCKVRALTQTAAKFYASHIRKADHKGRLHLDHKLAVASGWYIWSERKMRYVKRKNVVPPSIMAHPCNLQYISSAANSMKQSRSCLSLDKLKKHIGSFGFDPWRFQSILKCSRIAND